MTIVEVTPGICGFNARISCVLNQEFEATLQIDSECDQIRQLAERLQKVHVLEEFHKPITETNVYRTATSCGLHAACPIPSAICKALEVAAGLALPADVRFRITKDGNGQSD